MSLTFYLSLAVVILSAVNIYARMRIDREQKNVRRHTMIQLLNGNGGLK